MKKTLGFALLALAVAGCASEAEVGQVEEGTALVRAPGDSAWKAAEIGSVLLEGDELRTRAGEGVTFRLDSAWVGMIENGQIGVGGLAADGARKVTYQEGDLFLQTEPEKTQGFLLATGAGMILLRKGALILRTDLQTGVGAAERAEGLAPPARVQVVVITGEAVIENLGRARTLARGDRGFLMTGRAPDEPRPIGEDVIADYEFAMGQALHRNIGAKWSRPPLFEPPSFPEPSADEEEPAPAPAPPAAPPAEKPAGPTQPEKPPGDTPAQPGTGSHDDGGTDKPEK